MGNKYVQCLHKALVTCKLKMEDGGEETYSFYPFVLNKYTGVPDHTGYSTIESDVAARLQKESKLFQAFVNQGLLRVMDELPASAQTAVDALAARDRTIYELNEENKKLKEQLEKGGITVDAIDKAVEKAQAESKTALDAESAKSALLEKNLAKKDKKIASLEADLAELERVLKEKGVMVEKGKIATF